MVMDNDDRRTVLVVDDEPHVVAYLEMVLQDQGYTTVSAANGREGMEKARTHSPDLICLDITMPEESGVRMYKNLKDDPDLGHIPVIVVTAVTGLGGDPEPFKNFLSSRSHTPPPEGFFSKPIEREKFIEKVSQVLARPVATAQ
jgi:CheY-like chemotaxis protein